MSKSWQNKHGNLIQKDVLFLLSTSEQYEIYCEAFDAAQEARKSGNPETVHLEPEVQAIHAVLLKEGRNIDREMKRMIKFCKEKQTDQEEIAEAQHQLAATLETKKVRRLSSFQLPLDESDNTSEDEGKSKSEKRVGFDKGAKH